MTEPGIPPPQEPAAGPKLTALTAAELATLLERSGAGAVTAADVATATGQGAPVNADGTFHFTSFVAWLARQVK